MNKIINRPIDTILFNARPITPMITFIQANDLNRRVTLKTRKVLRVRSTFNALNVVLPEDRVISITLIMTINPSNIFILSLIYPITLNPISLRIISTIKIHVHIVSNYNNILVKYKSVVDPSRARIIVLNKTITVKNLSIIILFMVHSRLYSITYMKPLNPYINMVLLQFSVHRLKNIIFYFFYGYY